MEDTNSHKLPRILLLLLEPGPGTDAMPAKANLALLTPKVLEAPQPTAT